MFNVDDGDVGEGELRSPRGKICGNRFLDGREIPLRGRASVSAIIVRAPRHEHSSFIRSLC